MACLYPGSHAAMLHTYDGAFKRGCYASKSCAMCCHRKLNMRSILVPILEYLRYVLSDFQTVFSIVMGLS